MSTVLSDVPGTVGPFRVGAARPWPGREVLDSPQRPLLRALVPDPPFSETVTRHFSLWPFGTRVLKLYLLVDPSSHESALMQRVLRAMRDEFFRSEARSQTNALRSALLAAHFVLREWNQRQLAHERVTASVACAVTRGATAYVVLAGEAAALSWDGELLLSHRATSRVERPLGGEVMPRVTFWSAPLSEGDRLVLACGGGWEDETLATAGALMRQTVGEPGAQLASTLAGPDGPARLLLARGAGPAPQRVALRGGPDARARQLGEPTRTRAMLVPARAAPLDTKRDMHREESEPAGGAVRPMAAGRRLAPVAVARQSRSSRDQGRRAPLPVLAALLAGAGLVAIVGVAISAHTAQSGPAATAAQAERLLRDSSKVNDAAEARRMAVAAYDLAVQADQAVPAEYNQLLARADRAVRDADRAYPAPASTVVHLGGASQRVADVVVTGDSLLVLDVQQGVVRDFDARGRDQAFESGRVVLRAGDAASGERLDTPVALAADSSGAIAVVDRSRSLWVGAAPQSVRRRVLPGAGEWKSLEGIGLQSGRLLTLDAASRLLAVYPADGARPTMIGSATAPGVPFERAVEVVTAGEDFFVRTTDGSVYRLDASGHPRPFKVTPPDAPLSAVSGMTSDRRGGLYLAEAGSGRIIHATTDGRFIRQLRLGRVEPGSPPRSLQTSPGGDRLYFADAQSLLTVALPAELPTAL